MKPFDLAAAQRGEKVQYNHGDIGGGFKDVHFVGVSAEGKMVVEALYGTIICAHAESLRMAPKPPKEMWIQLFFSPDGSGLSCTNPRSSPDEARRAVSFCTMAGEPQKVLVPEDV